MGSQTLPKPLNQLNFTEVPTRCIWGLRSLRVLVSFFSRSRTTRLHFDSQQRICTRLQVKWSYWKCFNSCSFHDLPLLKCIKAKKINHLQEFMVSVNYLEGMHWYTLLDWIVQCHEENFLVSFPISSIAKCCRRLGVTKRRSILKT